jgi:hypothetical protein
VKELQAKLFCHRHCGARLVTVAEGGRFSTCLVIAAVRLLLPAALVALLMTGSAEGFALIGSGVESCGTWTASRRQSEFAAIQPAQWILGFLSGAGYMSSEGVDPLNRVDAQAVWAWVDNYCLAHPLESIEQAGVAFIDAHPR